MRNTLTATTRRRLDIQGFEGVDDRALAPVAPWLRLAFGLCAAMAAVGTALASPTILLLLAPIAFLAALLPVHPFDLIYNHGIRFVTDTSALPRRGAPSRFACGLGAVWLLATAWAFQAGHRTAGYVLGALMAGVALLVSTTVATREPAMHGAFIRMLLSQLLEEAGGDRAEAARRAGVGRTTMYRWIKDGLLDQPIETIRARYGPALARRKSSTTSKPSSPGDSQSIRG